MKVYFDRTLPMFLSEESTFDGHLVDIDEEVGNIVLTFGRVLKLMEEHIYNAGAPEDSAQELADTFCKEMRNV